MTQINVPQRPTKTEADNMAGQDGGDPDTGLPNIRRMREKLAEAGKTARTIYQAYPDPSPIEATYAHLQETLDTLGRMLRELEDRLPLANDHNDGASALLQEDEMS
jgi:hypothetical protein